MAILHRKAGQYGKGEATRRGRRIMLWLVALAMGWTLCLGWVIGYFWGRYGALVGAVAEGVFVMAALFALPRIERHLDRLPKARIKYLRGGQGEALVAWLLKDADDSWHLFNGIQLEAGSDIDHVLVGPGGVYCISTKSHRGLFVATPDGLLHNNKPCDFARQAMRQTMALQERLKALLGADVPWVQAVLAVPMGYVDGDWRGAASGKVWVVNQETIIECLTGEKVPRRLGAAQVGRVARAMEMLITNAAVVYRRGSEANNVGGLPNAE